MPASASFLNTALAVVQATAEYTAFQAALANLSAAGDDSKQAAWVAAYSDGQIGHSPAYRVRKRIRHVVANVQVSLAEILSQVDAEAAYQQLTALIAPEMVAPVIGGDRTPSLTVEDIDLIRLAAARLASD